MDERDRRYEERFQSQESALGKAESALREYKASANEFRGSLDDLATKLMPRTESELSARNNADRIEKVRDEARGLIETLRKEVVGLQQSESQGKGRSQFTTPIMLGIVSIIIAAVVGYLASRMAIPTP